jgi:hypothetical protein
MYELHLIMELTLAQDLTFEFGEGDQHAGSGDRGVKKGVTPFLK